MKRVVAIVIIMALVTTLFAFSVYAETPVQPLQVVTYSDTTTNVRISGTAERLHYNIDSFQVVFMSPPNNYGTSCTPILVSFRFYNASDLPAYIGQAEFELTATTSTGSVNTIIYGYDQISTDLFVAESSYSTGEVGRIGIGASNDFAYYTGFVIPPKTSLYFSCIVYVNASAYAQNNTGATEDVNQVTLSSLNLYTNQISFSADYPYHNEPVDFGSIIDAISDLSDTVSTSSEMQSIIDLLTYTGTDYQYQSANIKSSSVTNNLLIENNNYGSVTVVRIVGSPYLISVDTNYDMADDTQITNGAIRYPVMFRIAFQVTTSVYMRNESIINNCLPSNTGLHIEYMYSDNFKGISINNNNLYLYHNHSIGGRSYYNSAWYNTYIIGYIDVPLNKDITFSSITLDNFFRNTGLGRLPYNPSDEYTILRDLYLSLTKDQNNDNTEEAQDMNDEIHDAEQVWYDNNSEALEQVGLSNYRFSSSQSSGIYQAVTQFQAVWNALGDWTNVYIFILILSISTYIIRHEPTTRVKQYRSSVQAERAERISYYGRKNAESRASSSGSTLKSVIRKRK